MRSFNFAIIVLLLLLFLNGNAAYADTTWVDIQHWEFIPLHENGPEGTTLTWINFDSLPHTVISDIGLFNSGLIWPSQEFSYTFNDTGVFYYHDSLAGGMEGHIHVHYPSELNTALNATPIGEPITIPASGGTFTYNITGTNQTNAPLTYSYWTKIYPPGNAPPYVALIPKSVTFPAFGSRSAVMGQFIPASAPPGVYRYVNCLGIYTTTIRCWDHFYFTKSDTGGSFDSWETGATTDWTETSSPEKQSLLAVRHYPEPFNPSTLIIYTIPADGFVRLSVHNLQGQRVATLVNQQLPAGTHQVVFNAAHLPTGLYLYRLTEDSETISGKMMLIK